MKALLEFYLSYFEFFYLDPHYRMTDSRTSGHATINASITLTGPTVSWQIANDRGQYLFDAAPTKFLAPGNWFRISIIRQHIDGYDERNSVSPAEAAEWIHENVGRIEQLFADGLALTSCAALTELENANADRYWGPNKE